MSHYILLRCLVTFSILLLQHTIITYNVREFEAVRINTIFSHTWLFSNECYRNDIGYISIMSKSWMIEQVRTLRIYTHQPESFYIKIHRAITNLLLMVYSYQSKLFLIDHGIWRSAVNVNVFIVTERSYVSALLCFLCGVIISQSWYAFWSTHE